MRVGRDRESLLEYLVVLQTNVNIEDSHAWISGAECRGSVYVEDSQDDDSSPFSLRAKN